MYNLILADLFKLRKSMAIKVLFLITTISSIAMITIAYQVQHGNLSANINGIGFMFSDVNIIGILGAVIAAVFICGDYDNKTIHDAISSGSSRSAVIVSKIMILCFGVIIILLPYAIVTGIGIASGSKFNMGSMGVGFLNILLSQCGTSFSASEMLKLLGVMLVLMIVYVAQLSICVPLALMLKKPVLVVAIYYGLTIVFGQLARLKNSSKTFDNIFACTPYGGRYSFITPDTGTGYIFKAILVSLIFIIAMIAITYSFFRKSEIK